MLPDDIPYCRLMIFSGLASHPSPSPYSSLSLYQYNPHFHAANHTVFTRNVSTRGLMVYIMELELECGRADGALSSVA